MGASETAVSAQQQCFLEPDGSHLMTGGFYLQAGVEPIRLPLSCGEVLCARMRLSHPSQHSGVEPGWQSLEHKECSIDSRRTQNLNDLERVLRLLRETAAQFAFLLPQDCPAKVL